MQGTNTNNNNNNTTTIKGFDKEKKTIIYRNSDKKSDESMPITKFVKKDPDNIIKLLDFFGNIHDNDTIVFFINTAIDEQKKIEFNINASRYFTKLSKSFTKQSIINTNVLAISAISTSIIVFSKQELLKELLRQWGLALSAQFCSFLIIAIILAAISSLSIILFNKKSEQFEQEAKEVGVSKSSNVGHLILSAFGIAPFFLPTDKQLKEEEIKVVAIQTKIDGIISSLIIQADKTSDGKAKLLASFANHKEAQTIVTNKIAEAEKQAKEQKAREEELKTEQEKLKTEQEKLKTEQDKTDQETELQKEIELKQQSRSIIMKAGSNLITYINHHKFLVFFSIAIFSGALYAGTSYSGLLPEWEGSFAKNLFGRGSQDVNSSMLMDSMEQPYNPYSGLQDLNRSMFRDSMEQPYNPFSYEYTYPKSYEV